MSAAKKPIVMVTGNKNKLAEFKQILGQDFPHEVRHELNSFVSVNQNN